MPVFPDIYKKYCERKLEVAVKYLEENDRILDAGCGDKNHPFCFSELNKNYKIVGVDLDSSWHPNIIKGDITHLELPDKSFDVVLCFDVLEHILEWKKAFNELIRAAKKRVIISVPTTENKVFFKINQLLRKLTGINNIIFAGHFRDYFPEEIINLAKNRGLSCELKKIRFATPIFSNLLFKFKLRYGGIFIINKNKKTSS